MDIVFERPCEVPVEALRRELVLRVRSSGGEVLSDDTNAGITGVRVVVEATGVESPCWSQR